VNIAWAAIFYRRTEIANKKNRLRTQLFPGNADISIDHPSESVIGAPASKGKQ
jgi:hypothetical protein